MDVASGAPPAEETHHHCRREYADLTNPRLWYTQSILEDLVRCRWIPPTAIETARSITFAGDAREYEGAETGLLVAIPKRSTRLGDTVDFERGMTTGEDTIGSRRDRVLQDGVQESDILESLSPKKPKSKHISLEDIPQARPSAQLRRSLNDAFIQRFKYATDNANDTRPKMTTRSTELPWKHASAKDLGRGTKAKSVVHVGDGGSLGTDGAPQSIRRVNLPPQYTELVSPRSHEPQTAFKGHLNRDEYRLSLIHMNHVSTLYDSGSINGSIREQPEGGRSARSRVLNTSSITRKVDRHGAQNGHSGSERFKVKTPRVAAQTGQSREHGEAGTAQNFGTGFEEYDFTMDWVRGGGTPLSGQRAKQRSRLESRDLNNIRSLLDATDRLNGELQTVLRKQLGGNLPHVAPGERGAVGKAAQTGSKDGNAVARVSLESKLLEFPQLQAALQPFYKQLGSNSDWISGTTEVRHPYPAKINAPREFSFDQIPLSSGEKKSTENGSANGFGGSQKQTRRKAGKLEETSGNEVKRRGGNRRANGHRGPGDDDSLTSDEIELVKVENNLRCALMRGPYASPEPETKGYVAVGQLGAGALQDSGFAETHTTTEQESASRQDPKAPPKDGVDAKVITDPAAVTTMAQQEAEKLQGMKTTTMASGTTTTTTTTSTSRTTSPEKVGEEGKKNALSSRKDEELDMEEVEEEDDYYEIWQPRRVKPRPRYLLTRYNRLDLFEERRSEPNVHCDQLIQDHHRSSGKEQFRLYGDGSVKLVMDDASKRNYQPLPRPPKYKLDREKTANSDASGWPSLTGIQ